MRAADLFQQVQRLTTALIEVSLCNEQKFPALRDLGRNHQEVTFEGAEGVTLALKEIHYKNLYTELDKARCFNIKMLDGALIQLQFEVLNDEILKHRLAFFPTPHFEPYETEPELYDVDELYAEILSEAVVAFPIRFDYDATDDRHTDVHHPKSHLTLGQYQNCRIPVSAPLTPFDFVSFILRNFYNPAYRKFGSKFEWPAGRLPRSISNTERQLPHICVFDDLARAA